MPTLSLTSFTRSQATDLIRRISTGPRDPQGVELEGNGSSHDGDISADGRHAVFMTTADNLGPDPGGNWMLLYKDLATGEVRAVSTLPPDAAGHEEPINSAWNPQISSDGRHVLFEAEVNDVPGQNVGYIGLFLKDLRTGALTRVDAATPDGQGHQTPADGFSTDASFTGNGRYVIFQAEAENLVPGTIGLSENIYRKDLQTGTLVLVSAKTDGQAAGSSQGADASHDGRYVVFTSSASDLVAGDTNGRPDIFRKDLVTGEVVRVSTGSRTAQGQEAEANGPSREASISADGRYVVFQSSAGNLVAGDTNGNTDIFRKDLVTGETIRVSTGAGNAQANGECLYADISADGRYVLFESTATNLDGGDGRYSHVFRKDLQTGEIVRIGAVNGAAGDNDSYGATFAADGHSILFASWASNFVPGDGNEKRDVFRVDNDLLPHRQAIVDGRIVKASFDVGKASGASISWGDGTSETLAPSGGKVSASHVYATAGVKAATVTVKEGAQTWIVPFKVDLGAGQMARDTARSDTLSGESGADRLDGDGFSNRLVGQGGNDSLSGAAGDDRLFGGAGKDALTGGAGRDAFVFDTRPHTRTNADKVRDYEVKDDSIFLDNAVFTKLGRKGSAEAPEKLKKAFFTIGDHAKDKNDYVFYDPRKAKLYYDQDGSGHKAAVEIASFTKGVKLKATEFFVI
jgi:Tol biopolymer transport system component